MTANTLQILNPSTLGPLDDEPAQCVGHGVGTLEDFVHQGQAGHRIQRVKLDDPKAGQVVAPIGVSLEQRRPRQTQDEQMGRRAVFGLSLIHI